MRGRPRQSHCKRGHSLDDPDNLILKPGGKRRCRTCQNGERRNPNNKAGGNARARALTPERRSEIARLGAKARGERAKLLLRITPDLG